MDARRSELITKGVVPGAIGGLAGGAVFGAAMLDLGVLSSVASLVRVESQALGFTIHMAIAATVGVSLGLLMRHQGPAVGESILWGMVYGTLWWFIGSLTLHPLFLGEEMGWTAPMAQAALPSLLGHVLYGATAALVIALWRVRPSVRPVRMTPEALVQGGVSGLTAAWIIGAVLAAQGHLALFAAGVAGDSRVLVWLMTLLIGLLAGVGFSLLYPGSADGAGPGIVRGTMYGFLWWVAVPLSLLPAVEGGGLPWQADHLRETFPTLPGYILFGGLLALLHRWIGAVFRALFSDAVLGGDREGVGTQGLRALANGVVSGVMGGLVFSVVMLQVGALDDVAGLVRARSPVSGFFVHLAIAVIIGASYGLLFRGQCYDLGSALGWGASYGFIWWLLGSMTLFSVFLGSTPQWTADLSAEAFPHLIGHLAYGVGVGVTFYLLEARYRPWWVARTEADATRVARRKEQVLTAAPALWTLVVITSVTLPVLLGTTGAITSSTGPTY